jgi:hypothetical protein
MCARRPRERWVASSETSPSGIAASGVPARQRKLWEIMDGMHCSVIGTCLSLAEIRKVARRLLEDLPRRVSDYHLHSIMVHHAQTKNLVSEALNKALNRRHEAALRRFARAQSEDAVRELWRGALAAGDAPGPYWASPAPGAQGFPGDVGMPACRMPTQDPRAGRAVRAHPGSGERAARREGSCGVPGASARPESPDAGLVSPLVPTEAHASSHLITPRSRSRTTRACPLEERRVTGRPLMSDPACVR